VSKRTSAALVILGIVISLILIGPLALQSALAGAGDFPGLYVGAKLQAEGAPYDPARAMTLQTEFLGDARPSLMPIRLPFYFAALRPLALLNYRTAHALWLTLLAVAAVVGVWIYPFPDRAALTAAVSMSTLAFRNVIAGQDMVLLVCILGFGLMLRSRGRVFAAGLILSCLLIKFHLFLPLPLLFLLRREYRLLTGFATGVAALLSGSFLVAGLNWVRPYSDLIFSSGVSKGLAKMPTLHGLAGRMPVGFEPVATVLVLCLALYAARFASFESGLSAALLAGILVGRHSYIADCLIVIPSLTLMALRKPSIKMLALFCLSPAPYWLADQELQQILILSFVALLGAIAYEGYRARRSHELTTNLA
jgi:hypothetical protein